MDKDKPSFDELKQETHDLKDRIEELRKRTAMPLNASLGDPAIDAANADGHNDVKDEDDE